MGIYLNQNGEAKRFDGAPGPAASIAYDNTESGFLATNTQNAIDEVNDKVNNTISGNTVELSNTATQAHAVGEYFIWIGQFVKTTTAIEVGDTIEIGTNVVATNVSSILTELNSKFQARSVASANYINIQSADLDPSNYSYISGGKTTDGPFLGSATIVNGASADLVGMYKTDSDLVVYGTKNGISAAYSIAGMQTSINNKVSKSWTDVYTPSPSISTDGANKILSYDFGSSLSDCSEICLIIYVREFQCLGPVIYYKNIGYEISLNLVIPNSYVWQGFMKVSGGIIQIGTNINSSNVDINYFEINRCSKR